MSEIPEDNLVNREELPKVSVIVPIYNGEADLPDLIACLRSQSYPARQVEYLLVDNNSSDRTADLIKAATEGITVCYLSENQIQSSYAARNTGIRAAKGEILAFTDADCRPQPHWLEKLVEPFSDLAIGLVVGEIVGLPGNSILEKYAERCNTLSQKYTIEHPFCPYGQTANLAIRRQAFKQVGLFRPYLTTGGDADICWRIQRETNWQLEFVENAIIRHRHRSTIKELQSQWRRYGRSNLYLHELYGVDLQRQLTGKESVYRLARWLLKELPISSIKAIAGKASPIDLIKTPIDLLSFQARSTGQRESKLSEEARKIERL